MTPMDINPNPTTGERLERRHRRADDQYFRLRNLLNIIFMLGAIVGVAVYMLSDRTVGTVVILVAMLFKIVECVFRLKR